MFEMIPEWWPAVVIVAVVALIVGLKKKNDNDDDDDDSGAPSPGNPAGRFNGSKTAFLMRDKHLVTHPYLSNSLPKGYRNRILDQLDKNGWNSILIYFANDGDYRRDFGHKVQVNPCNVSIGHPEWGKKLESSRMKSWETLIRQLRARNKRVFVFLFADDWDRQNKKDGRWPHLTELLVRRFDHVVDGWVPVLEANEVTSLDNYRRIVKAIRKHSKKPIGCHLTSMAHRGGTGSEMVKAADVYCLQTGFNLSVDEVGRRVKEAINRTRKPVVAAEYNIRGTSGTAKQMGRKALKRGAIGAWNGV